jgi:hypothetical protein
VKRQQAALARLAEQQGFRVRQTRSGWTVYGKDGTSTVGFHRTPSDHRAYRNARADLKRIGVQV